MPVSVPNDPEVRRLRARIAGLSSKRPGDPEIPELRKKLDLMLFEAEVRHSANRIPLTRAQRKRLAALILAGDE